MDEKIVERLTVKRFFFLYISFYFFSQSQAISAEGLSLGKSFYEGCQQMISRIR